MPFPVPPSAPQQGHLALRQQPLHQPAHVPDGDVVEALWDVEEGRREAAAARPLPGGLGLFAVGGVVLADAALERLAACGLRLGPARGHPVLDFEGEALPEAQLLGPRLHQLGAEADVLGAVLPHEPVGQRGEQLLLGAHRAEVGHEVLVAARGALGLFFLHRIAPFVLFRCSNYNHERLCRQGKLSALFCTEKWG